MSNQTATGIETRLFVGGEWVDAEGGATFEDRTRSRATSCPRSPPGRASDAQRAVEAAAAAFPEWAATPPAVAPGDLPQGGRHSREPAGRGRVDCSRARRAARSASGCSRCTSPPACFRQAAALAYAPHRRGDPLGHPGSDGDGCAAAGRRRRRDRAVERGADPLAALDHRAARARQHRRAQAVRVVAGVGRACSGARSSPRRDCRPGVLNIVTHAPGEAAGDRRRARREPAQCGASTSPARRATGRRLAEACGRQLKRVVLELGGWNPLIVLGGCRSRLRRRRRGVRLVPPPGPDLHVDAADHRRAPDRRRVHREARREDAPASRSATRRSTTRSSGR